ncbi:hypothetical protein PL9631_980020 [Planktothrix paucivesiculata PCC 9631]|uniref:Uncharacterized protein n=1 Tax=Planktothrix paucivesiculata PCC 9631 TaxID=671071 RepID=A0A7Z9C006_9CYAN|nr:hypothetical protein PL9631_60006 [Planktothrix paucivesiculata PCC 9631]VXD25917.1 hypothetical protein PL9631_980020 [Planktothrix paucivesiculata PCC 9631]
MSSRTETYAKELMEGVTHVWVYNLDGVEIISIKIWQLQESWN